MALIKAILKVNAIKYIKSTINTFNYSCIYQHTEWLHVKTKTRSSQT